MSIKHLSDDHGMLIWHDWAGLLSRCKLGDQQVLTNTVVPVFVFELPSREPYIASIFESMPVILIFSDVELADEYRKSYLPNAQIKELSSLQMIASYIGAVIGHPEIVLQTFLVVDPPDDTFASCKSVDAAQYLEGLAQESSRKLTDG